MKHLLKHKLSSLMVVPLFGLFVALGGIVVPAGGAVAASPLSNFAVSTITCGPNEQPVPSAKGDVRSCCPKGVSLQSIPKNNEKQAQAATSANSKACLYAKYVNPFINLLSAMVGLVVVIGIIIGAIQFSASAGDPQQAAKGKNHIRNALIGLVAYLFFYATVQFMVPGGLL